MASTSSLNKSMDANRETAPMDNSCVTIQKGGIESPEAGFLAHDHLEPPAEENGAGVRKKSWTDAAASGGSDEEEKSPMYTAIFNMLAGCGIVGLPLQTAQSGILVGMLLMAMVAVFSIYTLRLLIKNGRRVGVWNYEDLCHRCWGAWGYYNLIASILLFDVGQCLTYSIILGNSAHDVFSQILSWDSDGDKKLLIIAAYIFFLFPFSIGKDFRFIEKISAFAILSIAFMIGVVTYEYFHHYQYNHEHVEMGADNVTDIVQAFGAIAFAFSQQDQTFLVIKTLINPTTNRFTILASWAMGIQFCLCATVGTFGYLSFGEDVDDDILDGYSKNNHLVLFTRVLYVFTMVFIFPTAFYVVRHIAYSCVFYTQVETYEKATVFWRLIFTISLLTFFCVLSLWISDLGMVMTVTGLVAVVNLTFILPCMIHLKLTEYPIFPWRAKPGEACAAIIDTWPAVALLVFGAFSMVVGIIGLFL